jgi:hypothetical protein
MKWGRCLTCGPHVMYGNSPSKQTYANFVRTVFLSSYIKQQNGGCIKSIFISSCPIEGLTNKPPDRNVKFGMVIDHIAAYKFHMKYDVGIYGNSYEHGDENT